MCGINGVFLTKENCRETIKAMNLITHHRGPDDQGIYLSENNQLGLGLNRLAILGVKTGKQPMISSNSRYVIVFNGEIFNYNELSYIFFQKKYSSDTKVLIELFQKIGPKALNHVNGMFAFAIYDKKEKKIILARDRFGIKPLYYYHDRNKFIFSSEIKSIKLALNNHVQLDYQSISNYITLNHTFGSSTVFKNIYSLEPGSFLIMNLSDFSIKKKQWYFPNIKKIILKTKNDYLLLAEEQLKKSLKLWTTSDVPISFLVSGGLDSGLLSSIFNKMGEKTINTFSLIFNNKNEKKWSEENEINKLTDELNSNHKFIIFNKTSFSKNIHKIVDDLDEPYAGGLPKWFLFREISKKFKVAIIGDGGDELFGNYNRSFNLDDKENKNKEIFVKNYFDKIYPTNLKWKKKYTNFYNIDDIADQYYKEFKKIKFGSYKKNISYLDLKTQLPNEFLYMNDLFSMRHSVEARTPYLDHELVELIYSFPEDIRISKFEYKPILRKIAMKYLPESYLKKKKSGLSFPLSIYLRGELKNMLNFYLSKKILDLHGIVKNSFYSDYVEPMLKGENKYIQLIWNIFILHMWLSKKNKNFFS
jgi:asparagine synthase (glutamine-hydrolysing)